MCMARLCDYHVMEAWTATMMRALMRPSLDGYAPISIPQLLRADRELFRLCQERSRSGIKVLPNGTLPPDSLVPVCSASHEVNFLLQPLPSSRIKTGQATSSNQHGQNVHQPPTDKKRRRSPRASSSA